MRSDFSSKVTFLYPYYGRHRPKKARRRPSYRWHVNADVKVSGIIAMHPAAMMKDFHTGGGS